MTALRPCFGCTARNDCDIKRGVLAALRGQPITSVRVKCDLPFTKYFPPGTRVMVEVWDWRDYDGQRGDRPDGSFVPATVVGSSTKKRGKVLCLTDAKFLLADDTEVEFITKWPKELQRLDQPMREVCHRCGRLLVHGECVHYYDDRGGT
jgi:hypothetical protein